MITEDDLAEAIEQCKADPVRYSNIEKLANLYTVRDHLFGKEAGGKAVALHSERSSSEVVGRFGDSDFLRLVEGKSQTKVWKILDELVDVLEMVNPRLHDSFLQKIESA